MTDRENRNAPRGGGRSLSGAVMLLIGLLVGIALAAAAGVFLLGIGWATPIKAQSVISASPTPSPSPSADGSTTEPGEVSEACVRAAEYNLVVDEAVDELARGAESQDALVLQETLDRLQEARETADGAAEECLAQAGKSPQSSQSASPEPGQSASPESGQSASPEPSPSPTS